MPNHTTISTATYRIQVSTSSDLWMKGDRYGTVQREYWSHRGGPEKVRMVLVLMDKSNKLFRLRAEDVTVL